MNIPNDAPEIGILGAGIIGLAAGLRLLAEGWRVVIHARECTPHTTSDIAAALWFPYKVAPKARVQKWATETRKAYVEMQKRGVPGISTAPLILLQRERTRELDAREWVEDAAPARKSELPAGFAGGLRMDVPRIETPDHMPWVHGEFLRCGGRFETREVQNVHELLGRHPLVINCSGVGARTAAADASVFPIRGQLVRVARPAGMDDAMLIFDEGDETTYVVPRRRDCILGGTAQNEDWNLTPDPRIAGQIVQRCAALRPELAGARILGHLVGLRPGRPTVRLELERRADGRAIIHDYGHGGAGFTLAWACADEVVELAREWSTTEVA